MTQWNNKSRSKACYNPTDLVYAHNLRQKCCVDHSLIDRLGAYKGVDWSAGTDRESQGTELAPEEEKDTCDLALNKFLQDEVVVVNVTDIGERMDGMLDELAIDAEIPGLEIVLFITQSQEDSFHSEASRCHHPKSYCDVSIIDIYWGKTCHNHISHLFYSVERRLLIRKLEA